MSVAATSDPAGGYSATAAQTQSSAVFTTRENDKLIPKRGIVAGVQKICVLAFSEPPPHWGFHRSRKGTSWFIFLEAVRVPRCLSALKAEGIVGKAIWDTDEEPKPSGTLKRGKAGRNRPRGKKARAEYDGKVYVRRTIKQAKAIADAALIEARKHKRVAGEETKRRREFARQAEQRLAREQQSRAEDIAADYLLRHPQGSA